MTIHTIELIANDGERVTFPCSEDDDVIAGAAAAGILLPSICRQGACGACRATCADGDYELGTHSTEALPAEARERREILLCRTFPRGNLSIHAPFGHSEIRFEAIPERDAEIVELSRDGDSVIRLALRLDSDATAGSAAEFEPGQFMQIAVPGANVMRAYSLANTANWDGRLEFLIRLQPGGLFSTWLAKEARPGQKLHLQGPQGSFVLKENGLRPRWFVAGGTGLAPCLSMLRRMAEFQEPHEARLYFGVGAEAELFARNELAQLRAELPKLHTEICVWRPTNGWTGFKGTPVDALRRDLAQAGVKPDIYVCGPPALIDAAEAAAMELGVPAEQLISERFLPC
jgi:ferredoxin-NADP reductase/ferredoxin